MAPLEEKETTETALSEIHKMVIIQLVVLWVMTPCSLRHGAGQGLLAPWQYLLMIRLYPNQKVLRTTRPQLEDKKHFAAAKTDGICSLRSRRKTE